jgi:two-component system sensor histidine kinase/response regulator
MAEEERAPSILVVDDTPANLLLLASMLKERGYEARPVPGGRLALQAAANDPPDLILLDITMPDMSGYEVCERLKASSELADIPVIFISASSETLDKVKAFGVGGVDYVTKPFRFEEVHARVATHLSLRQLRSKLAARNLELETSLDQLRRLEAMRDSLVHMIIHDLRSPLTAICMLLDSVVRGGDEASAIGQRADIERARSAAKKMIHMVNAVLDVSKMEAGEMVLDRSVWNVVDLVREIMEEVGPLAIDRQLVCDAQAEHFPALADRGMVARVLQNLLSNAIRFSPPRSEIRVGVDRLGAEVLVSVSDEGQGIPADQQTRIFEKFAQVEARSQGKSQRTTGLGLTFCKLAVEAHGGQIGVISQTGKGSSFWFTLPGTAGPG